MEWLDWIRDIAIALLLAISAGLARIYLWIKHMVGKVDSLHEQQQNWFEGHHRAEENHHKAETRLLEELAREARAQTHYLEWLAEHQTGQKPPPFLNKRD